MSYSNLTDRDLQKVFDIRQVFVTDLFAKIERRAAGEALKVMLSEGFDLALSPSSEKARSEYLIAPVLLEVRRQTEHQISVFSGIEFNVEPEKGLFGRCDFLISRSPFQDLLEAPVVVAVEAKQEDFDQGITQCAAEMIAARIFNERENNAVNEIYGCVTTGDIWRFLILRGKRVEIEKKSFDVTADLEMILGILWAMACGTVSLETPASNL